MSDNPYESPQSDLVPPDLQKPARATEYQKAAEEGNARFSMFTLFLLMSCAAVNAAAYAQPASVLPFVALLCNAILFLTSVRDIERNQNDVRMMAYCVLTLVMMFVSGGLLLLAMLTRL